MPPEFTGAELTAHLVEMIRTGETETRVRVLLPLSEIAEPTLEHGLREAGLAPERVTAYRTFPSHPDAVRQTPSSSRNWVGARSRSAPRGARRSPSASHRSRTA